MPGLTPKKKEELKQMMGKYSGKASLSLLSLVDRNRDVVLMEDGLEVLEDINWSEGNENYIVKRLFTVR